MELPELFPEPDQQDLQAVVQILKVLALKVRLVIKEKNLSKEKMAVDAFKSLFFF